ncbi:MAG: hypothetical protein ACI3Z7_03520 [Candidatus Aphodosoma sp.]
MDNGILHIGQMLERELKAQGRSVAWLAEKLCCSRTNAYKIIKKQNIDIELLLRISKILQHDFFRRISDSLPF